MNTDSRWIWAVAARCALYCASLGAAFLLLGAFLFGAPLGLLLWLESREPSELKNHEGIGWFLVIALVILLMGLMTLIGAIGGAISGFYSPPRENWFPPRSPFFRRVLKSGLSGFFLGALFGCSMGFICYRLGTFAFFLVSVSPFCGQIYGVARGLNPARRAALALPNSSA